MNYVNDVIARVRANDPTLKTVDFNCCGIEDLSFMKGNTHVCKLLLRNSSYDLQYSTVGKYNDIRDLSPLEGCTGLKILDISFNPFIGCDIEKGILSGRYTRTMEVAKTRLNEYILGGIITPQCIGKDLPNLRSIEMIGCWSLGYLTNFLAKNEKLRVLGISIGKFRNVDEVLCSVPNLRTLRISNCELTDLSFLKNVQKLTFLDAGRNFISDISYLKYVKHLQYCNLSYNNIRDISSIQFTPLLRYIKFSNNCISDISAVKYLPCLLNCNLEHNIVSSIENLKFCKNITNLDLDDNVIEDISSIKELEKLKILSIRKNTFTDCSALIHKRWLIYVDLPKQHRSIKYFDELTAHNRINFKNRVITLFELMYENRLWEL